MTSPIIYETFDQWFHEQEGYSLRSERAEGEIEWLKDAFEAGRALAISACLREAQTNVRDCLSVENFNGAGVAERIEVSIRKLGENK